MMSTRHTVPPDAVNLLIYKKLPGRYPVPAHRPQEPSYLAIVSGTSIKSYLSIILSAALIIRPRQALFIHSRHHRPVQESLLARFVNHFPMPLTYRSHSCRILPSYIAATAAATCHDLPATISVFLPCRRSTSPQASSRGRRFQPIVLPYIPPDAIMRPATSSVSAPALRFSNPIQPATPPAFRPPRCHFHQPKNNPQKNTPPYFLNI